MIIIRFILWYSLFLVVLGFCLGFAANMLVSGQADQLWKLVQ